ncbi:RNA polymerase sigma factor [candidate division CSSED10-310 bacterium]|uniref:RNA polymerase sigma factor n=1 Tax=candidate division CSSED10-310 bacterium TaxID=2855610 RepID=A0ABV6Z205_UNCC1
MEVNITEIPIREKIRHLFNDYYPTVYRTAYRITGRTDDAEDILQTVFLKLVQLEKSVDFPENPTAYLYRATVNSSLDLLRRKKRWKIFSLNEDSNLSTSDHIYPVEQQEIHDQLRAALINLSALESKVFIMKYFENMSNTEISEILETSSNNINVALHSARKKLKKKLFKYLERT